MGEPEEDLAWERTINEDWASEWNDPREDIYTLEDGNPVDDGRQGGQATFPLDR